MAAENKKTPWWRMRWFKWGNGLKEIAIVGFIYLSYRLASNSLTHKEIVAFDNSYDVVNLEKHLGIFVERSFQSLFLHSTVLIQLANVMYTFLYYPALIIFGIWAYHRHKEHYVVVRNVFLVSAGVAFLIFALHPTAPPRMLSELGFVDTMARYGTLSYGSSGVHNLANPYAAMPSLHFGWTLLIGIATFHIARDWKLRIVGIMVPLGMFVAIVATANHFILDAVAGAVVIGAAYILVRFFSKLGEALKVYGAKRAFIGQTGQNACRRN